MTDNTTPERKSAPRPTKFPKHLAVMISEPMKLEIIESSKGSSQGEIVRRRLELGRDLEAAFVEHPELEANVRRLAREGSVEVSRALGLLVDFAVREADRRSERNANAAAMLARGMAEAGFAPDGVDVGNVSIALE